MSKQIRLDSFFLVSAYALLTAWQNKQAEDTNKTDDNKYMSSEDLPSNWTPVRRLMCSSLRPSNDMIMTMMMIDYSLQ